LQRVHSIQPARTRSPEARDALTPAVVKGRASAD
jgi:hypothetical protein